MVILDDGDQIGLNELKKGYFQNKEYDQKSKALEIERQEMNSLRENHNENARKIRDTYQNLTQFLERISFTEPDPQLARSDPASYQYQNAMRNNALAQLQNVYAGRENSEAILNDASLQEMDLYRKKENSKLLEIYPHLKDIGRKAAFDENNRKAAMEFGFQEDEIKQTADHRVLQLVHYARLGKIAERNRKNAARRIAETPRKGAKVNSITGKPTRIKKQCKI